MPSVPTQRSTQLSGRRLAQAIALPLAGLLFVACSDDEGPTEPSSPPSEMTLGDIDPADQVHFDVTWTPDTRLAEEDAILNDVENLEAQDGVYRVDAESPLLDGLEAGDRVVWPQLGIFDIQELEDEGDVVAVHTEWARFSDAVEEADIQFAHALRAGASGRAVGVAPADQVPSGSSADMAWLTTATTPVVITEDGVQLSHDADGYDIQLQASGDAIDATITVGGDNASASINGQVRGMQADGAIVLNGEDEDPAVGIHFNDITVDVEGDVTVSDSRGEVEITPDAVVAFPFTIGPIPAFVAIGTRLQIRSSISRTDTELSANAGFNMNGSVSVGRNPGGGFGAEGEIQSFNATGPAFSYTTMNTAGIGLDFDAPRVTFGLGRPGLSPAVIYGTQSGELNLNVSIPTARPDEGYCATGSTNAAVTVGGAINALVWSADRNYVIAQRDGPSQESGTEC